MMPKVSVLVPIYNVAQYLPQCLDSLLTQTLQDIEIICVDDGSTDQMSGTILDSYAEKDDRIIALHKDNTGYGNTMNVALSVASGEYVAILESDDYAEPFMVETLYAAAVKQKADIVKANYCHVSPGERKFIDSLSSYPKNVMLNATICPRLLDHAFAIWSAIYRREFLNRNNIRFHETPGAAFQDISFALQAWLFARRVFLIPDAVMYYRKNNPDSSMHSPNNVLSVFDEYEWIEELFKSKWKEIPILERYFVAAKYWDYLKHYQRVAAPYQYALLTKLADSLRADFCRDRIQQKAFKPSVWERISQIHNDKNKFFQTTAKELHDPRFNLCQFQNESIYTEGFLNKVKQFPQIIIYGFGRVGKRLAEELKKHDIDISCFAVTTKKTQPAEYMGISVHEIQELIAWKESSIVIVATFEYFQYEIYRNLEKHGFSNVCRIDAILQKTLLRNFADI